MDEKKIVTFEMFKKYHEQLMGYIEDGDGLVLDDEDILIEEYGNSEVDFHEQKIE